MKPMIQIAGVKSLSEAEMIVKAGANYLGFPLRLDVHAPDVSEAEAAQIIASLHSRSECKCVLITYLNKATDILDFMQFLGVDHVQLHGSVDAFELEKMRLMKKDLFIIKSLVVRADNETELEQNIKDLERHVDAFITDTFDPHTGASGATGKTHDWGVSKRLVEISSRPVILAGGIKPANVEEAIKTVRPAGIDVHTGVEDQNGNKDPNLVGEFVAKARLAFRLF